MQPPKRILIVEDSPTCATALKRLVESLGFIADVVSDGERALVQASCHQYSMILMDLRLPGRDGFATATAIRSHDRMVPIVSMTAYPLEGDLAKAADAAMDGFMSKSEMREQLARALAAWSSTASRDGDYAAPPSKSLAAAN